MILLSFRKNFSSSVFFGQPRARLGDGMELGLGELARLIEGKRVLLIVHGYHNGVVDTMDSYGTLEQTLRYRGMLDESGHNPRAYELVVGVLWPGSFAVLGFWLALLRAAKAGKMLADLIRSWNPSLIDIETHSAGAVVACEAMLSFRVTVPATFPRIRNLLLTAPAVPENCFNTERAGQTAGRYNRATYIAESIFAFHSTADRVLGSAYRRAMGGRSLGFGGPLGVFPSNVIPWDCSSAAPSHGSYKSCWMLFDFWRKRLYEQPTEPAAAVEAWPDDPRPVAQ